MAHALLIALILPNGGGSAPNMAVGTAVTIGRRPSRRSSIWDAGHTSPPSAAARSARLRQVPAPFREGRNSRHGASRAETRNWAPAALILV